MRIFEYVLGEISPDDAQAMAFLAMDVGHIHSRYSDPLDLAGLPPKKRPGFQRMMAAIATQSRSDDAVSVSSPAALGMTDAVFQSIVSEIKQSGLCVLAACDGVHLGALMTLDAAWREEMSTKVAP